MPATALGNGPVERRLYRDKVVSHGHGRKPDGATAFFSFPHALNKLAEHAPISGRLEGCGVDDLFEHVENASVFLARVGP